MNTVQCLIKNPRCGLQAGNPVCAKCGLDTRVGGYTSQQAGEEARSKAIAAWEVADRKEQAELSELEQCKAQEANRQAEKERLEEEASKAAQEAQAQRLAQERAEAKAQAERIDLKVAVPTTVLVGVVIGCLVVWDRLSRKEEFAPVQAVALAATPTPDCRQAYCPEMVVLPAGSFRMGSNDSEADIHEKPVHSVSVKSFAIGKYEVTQGQWRAIMGSNPSYFTQCGDNCPVDSVSWNDIQSYIQKLNQKTGQQYRLPSEAEWEYACRGGQQQKYCGSDNLDSVAWVFDNNANTTHPVGQKSPNSYGLYDMSGNALEWVHDRYNQSYQGAPTDGSAWESGSVEHVLRGGSRFSFASDSRAAYRGYSSPGLRVNGILSFRLARTVP